MIDPESVVQRQLDCYNAKDRDGWLSTYAPDAEQFELHGVKLAAGHAEISARIAIRFTEPNLHAELLSRVIIGNIVVDHEEIARDFSDGPGTIEMICVYEVIGGFIQKATFASGEKKLTAQSERS